VITDGRNGEMTVVRDVYGAGIFPFTLLIYVETELLGCNQTNMPPLAGSLQHEDLCVNQKGQALRHGLSDRVENLIIRGMSLPGEIPTVVSWNLTVKFGFIVDSGRFRVGCGFVSSKDNSPVWCRLDVMT
jgi:hypothetical protein